MLVAHAAWFVVPLAVLLPLAVLAAAPARNDPEPRTITVSGAAEIRVAPDQVQLWMHIETSDRNLAAAKKSNDERVKRTLAVLKQLGIDPKHVQTDYLTVAPSWNDPGRSRDEPRSYSVAKSIVVTLTALQRFEELVSAVLEGGVNAIDGIQFRTTELRKHRDEARALALKAAREKAAAMAGELGMKVGKPRSISESGDWFGYSGRGFPGGQGMSQNVMQNASGGGEPSEEGFAPGRISVRANVQVTFDLTE